MGIQEKIDTALDMLWDELEKNGEALCYWQGSLYQYKEGAWEPLDIDKQEQRLDVPLADACRSAGTDFGTRYSAIYRTLRVKATPLGPVHGMDADPNKTDEGPYLALPNGTLDLGVKPVELVEWSPMHYTTRKLAIKYDPEAGCPHWEAALDRMLDAPHRTKEDVKELRRFLQEWVGVNLVGAAAKQSRNLKSGLIIDGVSRTGKSTFADMFRELVGHHIAPEIETLGTQFGKGMLIGNPPIISDDGIKAGSKGDASILKRIITGEPMTVDRKMISHVTIQYSGAVLWTTNTLPKIADESDAIYNRFVLVKMQRVFTEKEATRDFDGMSPIEYWRETNEFPGILNWAIEGFERASERGHYVMPSECKDAAVEFRMANDHTFAGLVDCFKKSTTKAVPHVVVGAVLSEHAASSHLVRISIKDAATSARRNMSDVFDDVQVEKVGGVVYFNGLALTPEGRIMWEAVTDPTRKIPQLKRIKEPEVKLC